MDAETNGSRQRNGWSRPVALPEDLARDTSPSNLGVVRLPVHVFWSGADRTWDLRDKRQRVQVYELVLTEGTEEDVRRFINVDELIELWADLWLPPHVRTAWSNHLRRLRGVQLTC